MKRNIYSQLLAWKASAVRKPLLVSGARQVGKTYALKSFGQSEYGDVHYFNFEERPDLSVCFERSLDPARVIEKLSLVQERKINSANTLLIFDEVQRCSEALTSLKYFAEKAPQYSIACAGSLLGIALGGTTAFPVGKVDLLKLFPLSFEEFLLALDRPLLSEKLEAVSLEDPEFSVIHPELSELFRLYLFIGGMPEVVQSYLATQDLQRTRTVQDQILTTYNNDFSKYVPPTETLKIRHIWDSVPAQLARENKKFTFSAVKKSARAREYEVALQWLVDAGLILRSHLCEQGLPPLKTVASPNAFKVFSLDTGLLGAMVRLSLQSLLSADEMFTQFRGALFENIVAQELTAHNLSPLYYWTSAATAEIDFLIEHESKVFPIEVKSGQTLRSKSLLSFLKRYPKNVGIRISTRPLSFSAESRILELPVYMLSRLKSLLSNMKDLRPKRDML